jgi:hypothetical protein
VKRRRGDVRDDVSAREREVRRRRAGLPDVLAHCGPDQGLTGAEKHELVAGLEVPVLVEDAVVRKKTLAVDRLHLAVRAYGAGVEEVAVEVRRADEGGDALRLGGDRVERPIRRPQEPGSEEKIFGRVARHRELREEDEVGARGARFCEAGDDPLSISLEVADDRVDLRERQPHL